MTISAISEISPTAGGGHARLDNLSLAHKEGWQRFVEAPDRVQPDMLTRKQIQALGDGARDEYDRQRRVWHANLGPIKTPQLATLHEDLWDIVDSNVQDGDKAKGSIAIDAFPGLGKTTAVLAFAKQFHQREIHAEGRHTPDGHQRWPVCRVGLTGNTGDARLQPSDAGVLRPSRHDARHCRRVRPTCAGLCAVLPGPAIDRR